MGNKLEDTARSLGRRASPFLFCQQIDELNVLQSDLIEVITHKAHATVFFFTL